MGGRTPRKQPRSRDPKPTRGPGGSARILGATVAPDEGSYALDDATISLALEGLEAGAEETLELRVPVGPVALDALLPTARAVSRRVSLRVIAHEEAQGRRVSCSKGCGACCRQLVPVSTLEARMVSRYVAAMEPARRDAVRARFAAARARMVEAGLLGRDDPPGTVTFRSTERDPKRAWLEVSKKYFSLKIPCPFLEDESCSIHGRAPMVCGEFNVSSPPELCATLDPGMVGLPRPIRMSEVLSAAVHAAAGEQERQVPLSLALDWHDAHGSALDGVFDGEKLFEALMTAAAEAE